MTASWSSSTRPGEPTFAFIGVGQIGGSLLLRAQQAFPRAEIRAADVNDDWRVAVRGRVDIVVLGTPLEATVALLPQILAAVPMTAIVLDTCSVKAPIHAAAASDPRFVGGHPMFGSEGQGFASARAAAVIDAPFILTSTERTAPEALAAAEAFVRALGAVPLTRSPADHDAAIAKVSQLPQIAAWALALAVGSDPQTLDLSGPGLRDTTRLAQSPPELWTPLLSANVANASDAIDALVSALVRVRDALDTPPRLQADLALARTTKRAWPLVRAGRLADRVAESSTGAVLREISARLRKGETIAPLHVGEPRLPLSPALEAVVRRALATAPIAYTETAGLPSLRASIAAISARVTGVAHEPSEVIVTTGAKQALHLALAAIVAPGDEVLIAQPSWVSFAELVRLAGGKPVAVETKSDASLDPEAFAAAIGAHTRAVILNTPNNPTGAVYSQKALDAVLAICARYDLWLLSDELYRTFVFEGAHASPLSRYALAKERGLFFDGIAKSHAMTGLRLGWATGPRPIIERMVRLASHETSCAPSVSQYVAEALLREAPDGDPALIAAVGDRRARLLASKLTVGPMQGAFYAWIPVPGGSQAAAVDLLSRGVAVMPGVAFGREGFIRVSYAVEADVLERAVAILHT